MSVIVPAFNAQRTLAATLDCLRNQTHTALEVLVIDDCSSDATAAVIETYVALDARIHHLKGPGQGVSAARNIGIAAATGLWLYFLDADDWVEPPFLQQMLDGLLAGSGDVAFCAHRRVMTSGKMTPPYNEPALAHAPFETFARRCPIAIHCILARTEIVRALGGFDVSLRTCEDWDLWVRLSRAGAVWVHVSEATAYYRAVSGSLSSKAEQMARDAEVVLRRSFGNSEGAGLGAHVMDQYPNGANPVFGTLEWSLDTYRLWMMICDSARPGSTARLPMPNRVEFDADWQPTSLISAVCVGLAAAPEELASRWSEFGPRLTETFRRIGEHCKDPSGALRMLYRFESLVLDYDDLTAPRRLARTMGLRVNLRNPLPLEIPEGVDRLYVYLCSDDKVLALVKVGVLGEMLPEDWRRLARDCGVRVPDRRLRAILGAKLRDRQRGLERRVESARARIQALSKRLPNASGSAGGTPTAEGFGLMHREVLANLSHEARERVSASRNSVTAPRTSGPSTTEAVSSEPQRTTIPWGRRACREDSVDTSRASRVPVLMYHRIADHGPAELARYRMTPQQFDAQMCWLRQNGYHAIVSSELEGFLSKNEPLPGRPVVITFDDGYQDFADVAWPILGKYGFSAEVFLVTDLVGQTSAWDQRFGETFALMSASTVGQLAREGVAFGSHLATHPFAEGLTTRQLASELLRSKMAVEQWIGTEVASLALPFGSTDQRVQRLAAECGYRTVFSTQDGYASRGANPMHLPRIEAFGGQSLFEFQRRVRAASHPSGQG